MGFNKEDSRNPSRKPPGSSPEVSGVVFNIQRYSIHDGPGIRTTVFLKGCGLSCGWCCNPESLSRSPQLGFDLRKCDGCGKCIAACPEKAFVSREKGKPLLIRERCHGCGECVPVCVPEALAIYGRKMTVREVFEEVLKDRIYYEGSGGGVTLSGGEAFLQPDFVEALFRLCRRAGVGTAVETAGYYGTDILKRLLPWIDMLLFDLKQMDSSTHARHCGKPNDLILKNAEYAAESGIRLLFRLPLIPGVNDSPENIEATSRFLRELARRTRRDDLNRIELLAYHGLGVGKSEALGLKNRMEDIKPQEPARVESVRQAFESLGTACVISR